MSINHSNLQNANRHLTSSVITSHKTTKNNNYVLGVFGLMLLYIAEPYAPKAIAKMCGIVLIKCIKGSTKCGDLAANQFKKVHKFK